MTPISDERLAEIVADKDNFYRDEIKSMARELQSLRAQGGAAPLEASPAPVSEAMVKSVAWELCNDKDLRITLAQLEHIELAVSRALRAALAAKGGQ